MMMSTGHGHGHGPGFTQSRHGRTQSRSEVTRRDGSAGYGTQLPAALPLRCRRHHCASASDPGRRTRDCACRAERRLRRRQIPRRLTRPGGRAAIRSQKAEKSHGKLCESHIYLMEMLDPILFDQNLNSKSRKATNQPNLLLGTSITMMMLLVYLQPAILKCNSTTSGCCSD